MTSITKQRQREYAQKREWVLGLWDQGFTARQIESITFVGYRTVMRMARNRQRPTPTPSKFSLLPEEIKKELDRALSDFERSQTPANWAKLQDARRRYEDHEEERKKALLHR